MQGWSRLDPAQRDQFFEAFVSAALRLDRVAMRDWLRKRLRNRPLAAPIDLTHPTALSSQLYNAKFRP
jgi:hypothetical protein